MYSDNHGQMIWDEHVKNNIFKKYITYPSQRRPPPPRNNVDVHLNYHGKNCDTCGNNIVTGERGIRVYTRLKN